eukprot:763170-Hanusia_phi.AAC.2
MEFSRSPELPKMLPRGPLQQVWRTRTCPDGVRSPAQRELVRLVETSDDRPTTVTFVNGSQDTMRIEMGRNDTVKVKQSAAVEAGRSGRL